MQSTTAHTIGLFTDHTLVVVNQISHKCIVGLDLLKKLNITADFVENKLCSKKQPDYSDGGVYSTNSVMVEPLSSKMVDVGIKKGVKGEIMVSPINREDRLTTPFGVDDASTSKHQIVITNPTIAPIMVKENERLASWEKVEDQEKESVSINAVVQYDENNLVDIGDDLNEEQTTEIMDLLKEFDMVLGINGRLGQTDIVEHKIELTDPTPVRLPIRRYAHKEKQEIDKQVAEMLEQGVICESQSPYSSPIVLVPKNGGGVRFCVDYREVNKRSKKWPYPMPRKDDNIDSFSGKKYLFNNRLQQWFLENKYGGR